MKESTKKERKCEKVTTKYWDTNGKKQRKQ